MIYDITHRTAYAYESTVTASYGQTHLLPRTTPEQSCATASVAFSPTPDDRRTRTDYHGNRCVGFAILSPHRTLVVEATSTVEVTAGAPLAPLAAEAPWEEARDQIRTATDPAGLEAREMVLASTMVAPSAALASFSAPVFTPGRPLLETVNDLVHRIATELDYVPGSTTVASTIDDVLATRQGVCQDFAHLAIGCLRTHGLAARYVSGYLETDPPPGRPRLQGADASHAWVAVHVPGDGWIGLDPTNDTLVGDRHITTAWGRDYRDVAPLEGIIFTDGTGHELDVGVDVVRRPTAGAVG